MSTGVIRSAVRKRCVDCSNTSMEVEACDRTDCALYLFRLPPAHPKQQRPKLRDIRKYCLWCCLENPNEVKLCPATNCTLHPYRLGRNPKLQGVRKANAGSYRPRPRHQGHSQQVEEPFTTNEQET